MMSKVTEAGKYANGLGPGDRSPETLSRDGWVEVGPGLWRKVYTDKPEDSGPKVHTPGYIDGVGYDDTRQRAMYGAKNWVGVPELSGHDIASKWKDVVPGNKGMMMPTKESLNSPQKRRNFEKLFPRFETH